MLLLAIFLFTTTLIVSGSPVGDCPEHQEGAPTYLPDSQDCQAYYECSNGKPVKNVCPADLQWDTVKNVCNFPDKVNCQNGKRILGGKIYAKQSLIPNIPKTPVGKCPVPQGANPVYLPDSEDCTIFYECDESGNACEKQCPPGTQFNPILSVCDRPENAGCTPHGSEFVIHRKKRSDTSFNPVGECPYPQGSSPVYLPDSKSCSIYYECSNGAPSQNFCADGLEWNPTLNTCDYPGNANCQAENSKKTKVKRSLSAVGECPVPQGEKPELLPDSEDCGKFYICDVEGNPILQECDTGLAFNPGLQVCDWPSVAGCTADQQIKKLMARKRSHFRRK